jgi:hypothetical protein
MACFLLIPPIHATNSATHHFLTHKQRFYEKDPFWSSLFAYDSSL